MPTISWSLQRFRKFVWMRRDPASADRASSAANALVRETHFAEFHAREGLSLIEAALRNPGRPGDGPGLAAFRQFMDEFTPGYTERPLREASFKASAHGIAFFRAAHAATDLMAPVIYWGLGLETKLERSISKKWITPTSVRHAMHTVGCHTRVVEALDNLFAITPYRYLRALANTTKHRELVPAGFSAAYDFTPDPKHGLRIGRFAYKDDLYEPVWAADFVKDSYPGVVRSLIKVGRAINAELVAERR